MPPNYKGQTRSRMVIVKLFFSKAENMVLVSGQGDCRYPIKNHLVIKSLGLIHGSLL